MEFERLKSSILLNAEESPSIYMALCMVESLFKDIEDVSGTDLSQNDPGDEQLPTKLIWLVRKLLKIYTENDEALQRNRGRLDDMMAKIREKEQSISEQSDLAMKLHSLKLENEALERKWQAAVAQKEEVEQLQAMCDRLNEDIQSLSEFDPVAARNDVTRLEQEKQRLLGRCQGLSDELTSLQKENTQLNAEWESLQKKMKDLQKARDDKKRENEKVSADAVRISKETERLQQEIDDLKLRKMHMISDQERYQQEKQQLQEESESFDSINIAPLRLECESLNQKKAQQKDELEQIKDELEQITENRNTLVDEISRTKAVVKEKQNNLQEKQQELSAQRNAADAAEKKLKEIKMLLAEAAERLSDSQTQTAVSEQEYFQQQAKLNEQLSEKKGLEDQIEKIKQQTEASKKLINDLRQEEAARKEELSGLWATRDKLTEERDADQKQKKELEELVLQLRASYSEEKQQEQLEQLKNERIRLENIRNSCEGLEQELNRTAKEIEEKKHTQQELQKRAESAAKDQKKIDDLLNLLAPYGSNELLQRADRLQRRVKQLEKSREQLEEVHGLIQKALGTTADNLSWNPEGLSDTLQQYSKSLDKMQKELLRCADSLKDQIKMEAN